MSAGHLTVHWPATGKPRSRYLLARKDPGKDQHVLYGLNQDMLGRDVAFGRSDQRASG